MWDKHQKFIVLFSVFSCFSTYNQSIFHCTMQIFGKWRKLAYGKAGGPDLMSPMVIWTSSSSLSSSLSSSAVPSWGALSVPGGATSAGACASKTKLKHSTHLTAWELFLSFFYHKNEKTLKFLDKTFSPLCYKWTPTSGVTSSYVLLSIWQFWFP